MPAKSARSRKLRAGVLHTGRAAAFLSIATGVNSVVSAMVPQYEPIYVYLVAVVIVAWLSSAILGVTAAVAATILYDWMFAPVRVVPSMSFAIPLAIMILLAMATRAARIPMRPRAALAEPVEPPLLTAPEPAAGRVEYVVDDTKVRELEARVAELKRDLAGAQMRASDRSRETQLASEVESLKQKIVEDGGRFALVRREADALAQRLTESEARLAESETILGKANERAEREFKVREQLQAALAEANQRSDGASKRADALQNAVTAERERADRQTGEYATAIAQRQKEAEAAAAKINALQRELDRTLASLADEHARANREASLRAQLETAARATLNRTAVVSSAHQREANEARDAVRAAEEKTRQLESEIEQLRAATEQQASSVKTAVDQETLRATFESAARQKAADEVATLRKELEASRDDLDHARSDADAAKRRIAELEAERDRTAAEFDANLQKVVANITADHEDALGEAVVQREAAKAEVRSLTKRTEELQKKIAKIEAQREAAAREFDTKLQTIVGNLTTDHENAIGDALLEREAAKAELRRVMQRGEELQRTVEEERQTRAKLEAEWSEKLQKIVAHLTEDHESDVGEAMLQREAARAEVRNLTAKLAASQKQLEDALRQLALRRTALQPVPTVEQRLPTVDRSRPHVVLVVHSDAGVRAMAKHTLEQSGYIVLTAADGLEGLRTATQQKPDVIIAEPLLPKMNARELVQLMKSKRETADVKIILLNANGDIGRGADFRADDVVRNLADFNELRTTLATVLSRAVTS